MKKKLFILGLSSLLLCGCGTIPTLSNGEEAIVTFSDGSMISVDEFYEVIKDQYGLDALVNMIDTYILEQEFADELETATEYAEAMIDQYIAYYGDEDTVLTMLSYYGYSFSTIDAFEDYLYLSYLQNEASYQYVEDNVTDEELEEYYENDVYPDMTISHIQITPDVTDDMTDDETEAAEEEALALIDEIIEALNESDDVATTFAELAAKYSDDDSTKDDGGNLGEINIGDLSSNYDELVKAAYELEDGEYSTEVITTELGYHVILKTATGEKASYEDSEADMREAIAEEKLSEDSSLAVDAIKYYRDLYGMDIIDSELSSQYGTYMNNLINSYSTSTDEE